MEGRRKQVVPVPTTPVGSLDDPSSKKPPGMAPIPHWSVKGLGLGGLPLPLSRAVVSSAFPCPPVCYILPGLLICMLPRDPWKMHHILGTELCFFPSLMAGHRGSPHQVAIFDKSVPMGSVST